MKINEYKDIFNLPSSCCAGDMRIPKTKLIEQSRLTKTNQKQLNKIKKIIHFATVQKSNTNILPFKDNDYDLQAVLFIYCQIKQSVKSVRELSTILHKSFPNPSVLVFDIEECAVDDDKNVAFSVSILRLSKSENMATVVENAEYTEVFCWQDPAYRPFLNKLNFECANQDDIKHFLQYYIDLIVMSKAISALGFYPIPPIVNYQKCQDAISYYLTTRNQIKNDKVEYKSNMLTNSESAKLRVKIKKSEDLLQLKLKEIKDLCNGRD